MRKIVELCYDSLIQAFLFLVEWLGLIIFASSNTFSPSWGRDWLALLNPSSSTTSLPCLKFAANTNPSLPTQRTIETAEFLVITRLGPDHLIPSLLECRPIFDISWRGPATKTSSPCTVPCERPGRPDVTSWGKTRESQPGFSHEDTQHDGTA